MPHQTQPLEFPAHSPKGYPRLANEPVFDPDRHLQIELPDQVLSLRDLGYSDKDIAECPTEFGVTSVFRLLSDEGAAAMLDVARQLEEFTTSNARIARNVRGGVYRSRFLRDLCMSPEVTRAMSQIAGADLLPHTLPHQMGHLNYNPLTVGENVDKWHVDTLRIDFVMFVTDPKSVEGGQFEYYRGTKDEVAALRAEGKPLDPAKIVAPDMPGPGFAVLQQGNMVVHRARGLTAPGERITMVNGYVPADVSFPDFTRYDQLSIVDPPHIISGEYARHMSWMARERIGAELANINHEEAPADRAARLEDLAALLSETAQQLRTAGTSEVEHFGDG